MTRESLSGYWVQKTREDLASARDNFSSKRYRNAVRDAYFACFHAFSSVLLSEGKTFRKHKEVRSALHRDYIRNGNIDVRWGKHYDWLFDNRQKADYRPLVQFEPDQVQEIIEQSEAFVDAMERLFDL
jgi:uncharacterized protein (UPF0332 family)